MKDKLEELLLSCPKIDFGAVNLSGEENDFAVKGTIFSIKRSAWRTKD